MQTPKNITKAHQLAFVYLFFASETDQQLASNEMLTISDKIENCLNKNTEIELNCWDIVSESLNWITSLNPQQKVENYNKIMDLFKIEFSNEQKNCLIEDLKEIAKSDGVVLEAEKKLITKSSELLNN
ncbi:MAG: hypothetical protein H8E60_04135 [Candidatus Marinimicrobia bacterium]|nr:hypothetical protein [Candidatus Neomarinimicrobiota bacterium]